MDGVERTMHVDDSACADLALGLTPEPERSARLAHVRTCPACESRLRAHVGAAERARADAPAPASRPRSPRHALRHPAVALALVAGLAAVALLPRLATTPGRAPASPSLPAPGAAVQTRAGETEDPRLEAGLGAWARHDFATAERELAAAQASGAHEQLRRLYLADVRYTRGDARSALELLRGLDWRTVPEPWRRAGVSLLARCLRARGEDAAADSIEHALRTQGPGTPVLP